MYFLGLLFKIYEQTEQIQKVERDLVIIPN